MQNHCNGIDLLDFFRGVRPWGQWYRFVAELPPHGKFKSAQANDPELARRVMDAPKKKSGQQVHPTLEGYDLPTRVTIGVFNMLKVLDSHLLAVNGNKVSPPQMWEIPKTALEREISYRKHVQVDKALAQLGVKT